VPDVLVGLLHAHLDRRVGEARRDLVRVYATLRDLQPPRRQFDRRRSLPLDEVQRLRLEVVEEEKRVEPVRAGSCVRVAVVHSDRGEVVGEYQRHPHPHVRFQGPGLPLDPIRQQLDPKFVRKPQVRIVWRHVFVVVDLDGDLVIHEIDRQRVVD